MTISIQLPAHIEDQLRKELVDVDHLAKEGFAIEAYRAEKLSIGQVAEVLGLTVYEAEGFMKKHGVEAPFSMQDFENDRATLSHLLRP